jgi:hypothetical protein
LDKLFLRQGFDKTILKFAENGPKTILLEGHDTLPALPNGRFLYLTKGTVSRSNISEFLIYKLWIHTHFSQALYLDWGKWDSHSPTSSVSGYTYHSKEKMHLYNMQARSLGHFNPIAVTHSGIEFFQLKVPPFRVNLSSHVIAAFLKTFVKTVSPLQIMACFLL